MYYGGYRNTAGRPAQQYPVPPYPGYGAGWGVNPACSPTPCLGYPSQPTPGYYGGMQPCVPPVGYPTQPPPPPGPGPSINGVRPPIDYPVEPDTQPRRSGLDNPVILNGNTLIMRIPEFAEVIFRSSTGDRSVEPLGLVNEQIHMAIEAIICENENGWRGKYVYQRPTVTFGAGQPVTVTGPNEKEQLTLSDGTTTAVFVREP